MQLLPLLAAMKFPQGDHLMTLKAFASKNTGGSEGGRQLPRMMTSPPGTWKTTGCEVLRHIATKNMRRA